MKPNQINYSFRKNIFITKQSKELSIAISPIGGCKYKNYYLSIPNTDGIYKTKYNLNLYHKDKNCPEYRAFASNKENVNITPSFLFTKQQAASVKAVLKKDNTYIQLEGFYPCPVCNPQRLRGEINEY